MALAIPALFNAGLSGSLSGMQSARQPIYDAAGELMQPADFLVPVEAAENFSTEEQAIAYTAPLPTAIPSYVSDLGGSSATTVPVNAAEANAAQSLPVAFAVLSASIFDGRNVPYNNAGAPHGAAFFSTWANSVMAMFQNAVGVMQQI
jgi:hypothetical protein